MGYENYNIGHYLSGLGGLPPMMEADTCTQQKDRRAPENQRMENEIRSRLLALETQISANPQLSADVAFKVSKVETALADEQNKIAKCVASKRCYCIFTPPDNIYQRIIPQVAQAEQAVKEALAGVSSASGGAGAASLATLPPGPSGPAFPGIDAGMVPEARPASSSLGTLVGIGVVLLAIGGIVLFVLKKKKPKYPPMSESLPPGQRKRRRNKR